MAGISYGSQSFVRRIKQERLFCMNVTELIKQNNEYREKLSEPSKKYYEEILVYMRTASGKNELAIEESLMEILQDILEAQKSGQTAEEYFGKNPKKLCDDLIEELPPEQAVKQVGFAISILILLFQYMNYAEMFDPIIHLTFFKTIVPIVLSIVVVISIFAAIRQEAFSKKKAKMLFFLATIAYIGVMLFPILDRQFGPFGPELLISGRSYALGFLFLSVICIYLNWKVNEFKTGVLMSTLFAIIAAMIALGLIQPVFWSKGVLVGITLAIYALFIVSSLVEFRKKK